MVLDQPQGKRESLLEQYRSERAALENKYNALFAPIYEKRADVVAGRIDVKAAEGALVPPAQLSHPGHPILLP